MLDADVSTAALLRQVKGSERIDQALRGVEFPISKPDLVRALANERIDLGDLSAGLADLARGVPRAKFTDVVSTRQALDARWARFAKNLAAVEQAERAQLESAE